MGVPRHVAIILDGNGRWAQKKQLPRSAGHKEGARRVQEVIEAAQECSIKVLTLFCFSTENWNRPKKERDFLFALLEDFMESNQKDFIAENLRLNMFGRRDRIPSRLIDKIKQFEDKTRQNTLLVVNIGLDYGGRWDIVQAVQRIARQVQANAITLDHIDTEYFATHLALSEFPDPDLLIRTSGEVRISNFLLWQLAYSELYFTDTLWPDFGKEEFFKAIESFSQRERRFGKVLNA